MLASPFVILPIPHHSCRAPSLAAFITVVASAGAAAVVDCTPPWPAACKPSPTGLNPLAMPPLLLHRLDLPTGTNGSEPSPAVLCSRGRRKGRKRIRNSF